MTQKRAKVGGEIGLNGEHYAAGTFICTTTLGKMAKATKKAATRKMQVGHYEWAVQPTPEARPLFVMEVGGVFADKFGRRRPLESVSDAALSFLGISRDELAGLIERHANGERWA